MMTFSISQEFSIVALPVQYHSTILHCCFTGAVALNNSALLLYWHSSSCTVALPAQ